MQRLEPIETKDGVRAFLFKVSNKHQRAWEGALGTARDILARIQSDGDAALSALAKEVDGVEIEPEYFFVPRGEIETQAALLDVEARLAIEAAADRIERFFSKECYPAVKLEIEGGGFLELDSHPYDRVGLYVPGGLASYPSSVLMLGIPARIAGVKERLVITPCLKGKIHPALAYALMLTEMTEVLRVGGPHGLAAAAIGTWRVRRVDKLFGPGNRYVTAMKQCLFGRVAIDMLAGPSEVVILADQSANPLWVWLDALAQLEHGSGDELAVVVALSERFEDAFCSLNPEDFLDDPELAGRAAALKGDVLLVSCQDKALAFQIANGLAPEHLSLQVENPQALLSYVRHAGAVFLGHYTPVALGDYALGTNHVLPTGGSARFWSSLSVAEFLRRRTAAFVTKEGFALPAVPSIQLGALEGFGLHAASIKQRFQRNE